MKGSSFLARSVLNSAIHSSLSINRLHSSPLSSLTSLHERCRSVLVFQMDKTYRVSLLLWTRFESVLVQTCPSLGIWKSTGKRLSPLDLTFKPGKTFSISVLIISIRALIFRTSHVPLLPNHPITVYLAR